MSSDLVISELIKKEGSEKFGIRPAHALEAARAPDQTDELNQEGLRLRIHSKWIVEAQPPYVLLVIERVSDSERSLDIALKLYSDLAEGFAALSPTHQLEALANRFGYEIAVGAQRGRFFWAARVPVNNQDDIRLMQGENPQNHSMISQMYLKIEPGPPMFADCALCFCLDVTTYTQWLHQHKR